MRAIADSLLLAQMPVISRPFSQVLRRYGSFEKGVGEKVFVLCGMARRSAAGISGVITVRR
jgi:hypothetical protein